MHIPNTMQGLIIQSTREGSVVWLLWFRFRGSKFVSEKVTRFRNQ